MQFRSLAEPWQALEPRVRYGDRMEWASMPHEIQEYLIRRLTGASVREVGSSVEGHDDVSWPCQGRDTCLEMPTHV